MLGPTRRTLYFAAVLFFFSGALGLGYEWIWIRKAALVVGASQIAVAAVLTSFFLGLAAGSYAVGRYMTTRTRSPLFVYGVFEILIGTFALAFPFLFRLLREVYGVAYAWGGDSALALHALRFALLFALFLLPTFLMGGTLPLLLDGLVRDDRAIGSRLSLLYGINVLGAVAGILATSYLAVPILGLNATSAVAGLANIALGAVAVARFRHEAAPAHLEEHPPLGRFFPLASFASGFVALAYQICWARYFSLIHFNSVYSTAMLLAVYLLALAAGSLVVGILLVRRVSGLWILALVQSLTPLAVWFCLDDWRLADYRFAVRREWDATGAAFPSITLETAHDYPRFWHFLGETPDAAFFAPFFQVALTIFLPVLLIGMGLPALIAAAAKHAATIKSVSGRLVFFNTLGASLGSFGAGYALIPVAGLRYSLLILGLASLVLALACGLRVTTRIWAGALAPGIAAAALVVLAFRSGDVTRDTIRLRQLGREADRIRLAHVVEGPLTTAYLLEDDATLRVGSGAVQMGNVAKTTVGLQVVEGHLPVLFYPGRGSPADCLGICLGSGQSFGALLRYPIRRLDVVEISGEITGLARGPLAPYTGGLASDPRVRFHLDDGRHFVEQALPQTYDVVSMESPPPIADGAHSLYTGEFYRQVRRVLRPGGVFMQFMPLYYLTPMDARAVMHTLAQEFPFVFVARVSPGDYMLLAYVERPTFSIAAMKQRAEAFATEWTSRGLPLSSALAGSDIPIASVSGVIAMLVSGPDDVRRIPAAVVLRDDRPLLSYTTGDRWLTRRYMGPTLASLSLAAVPIGSFDAMAAFFYPPLDPDTQAALTDQRAEILRAQGIPHPRDVEHLELGLELAVDPGDRIRRAIGLATLYDAALRKEDALRALEVAVATLAEHPDRFRAEWVDPARRVVQNRLAIHAEPVGRWIDAWKARYAASPLLPPLVAEWDAFVEREAAGRRQYLLR